MICTRCGTEQRRETARFCHVCGATIEPASANAQPYTATAAPVAAAPQPAHGLRPISLTPPESAATSAPESDHAPETKQAAPYADEAREAPSPANLADEPTVIGSQPFASTQQPFSSSQPHEAEEHASEWQQEPPTHILPQPASWAPPEAQQRSGPAAAPPPAFPSAWAAPEQAASPVFPEERSQPFAQEEHHAPGIPSQPRSWSQPAAWPEAVEQPQEYAPAHNGAQAGWNSGPPAYAAAQPMPPESSLQESANTGRDRPFPAAQHRQRSMANDPFGEAEARQPARPASMPERPTRSAAGPVAGSLTRPRPAKRRRIPLGVSVTIGLLLVFALAGVGIYALASGSGGQEPSAFVSYTDPNHHFSVKYPNVWNYKHLDNGARFADATNTAQLSITYTPNTSNVTAQQFADQEAQKEGLNTPDTKTFAGQTWVVRSGIVTQTSGIAQDIFIFVTVSNNLLYEIREVTPLDGYEQPNQAAFMPMLQSLTLS